MWSFELSAERASGLCKAFCLPEHPANCRQTFHICNQSMSSIFACLWGHNARRKDCRSKVVSKGAVGGLMVAGVKTGRFRHGVPGLKTVQLLFRETLLLLNFSLTTPANDYGPCSRKYYKSSTNRINISANSCGFQIWIDFFRVGPDDAPFFCSVHCRLKMARHPRG